ncbi:YbjN domain-containing protein [Lutibacter aestuarii]|uniref:YbjN domain-containing protein n=1 Tax=Lutibacter aestuarii TaxID=861111 RepID=A0ABW2Z4T1_9FLAO
MEVKSSYVTVKDKYKTFIDLDSQKRYITLSGNYALKPNLNKVEILDFINKINTEVALVKAYYKEANNSINYIAYLWIEKGFTEATLIKTLQSYNLALDLVLQKDPNLKFLK